MAKVPRSSKKKAPKAATRPSGSSAPGQPPRPPDELVVLRDLRERNDAERRRLENRRFALERRKEEQNVLPPELQEELDDLVRKTEKYPEGNEKWSGKPKICYVDPMLLGVLDVLFSISEDDAIGNLKDWNFDLEKDLPDWWWGPDRGFVVKGSLFGPILQEITAVYGLMVVDGHVNPELDEDDRPQNDRFIRAVSAALGEYSSNRELYEGVLEVLFEEGEDSGYLTPADGQDFTLIRASQWAQVVRTLHGEGVTAETHQFELRVRHALAYAAGEDGVPTSALEIELPDLEEVADVEIQQDNIKAMQALYFAAMLDEMKLFQVVDVLIEQFHRGLLPLGRGPAGDRLYRTWKKSTDRLSEAERRNLYARAFGFPGGDASLDSVNRDFSDLWLRFLSAVSSFVRQVGVEHLLRQTLPFAVSLEQVKKSGRDLAANLSLFGYGVGYYAAVDLQEQIEEYIKLLSEPEIKTAYGARDMWQVIDQVATLELGGARNSVRYRTMATAGAVILRWLAKKGQVLAGRSSLAVLDLTEISNPTLRARGVRATTDPTDRDLVDACEQWLAVTGTPETQVEEYAQPIEGPATTSLPVRIPQAATDLLRSVGANVPPMSFAAPHGAHH